MSLTDPKRPECIDKHIGLEVELLSPFDRATCIKLLTKCSIANCIQIKNDGSITRDGLEEVYCKTCDHICEQHTRDPISKTILCHLCGKFLTKDTSNNEAIYPHELNILFKEKDLPKVIGELASIFHTLKAYVNNSCGLHVHLDMRSRDPYACFERLVESQDMLYKLVKKDRRKSDYCRRVPKGSTFDEWPHRNSSINPTAFRKHQTIEVRLHHGTTSVKEIFWWVKSLVSIVEGKKLGVALNKYITTQTEAMKKAS
jgi:hypothetical protein